MLELLLELDKSLFYFINVTLSNPVFDYLLPLFRSKSFWLPLYIIIALYLIYRLKWNVIQVFLLFSITVFITDFVSSELIKKTVMRIRPCNDESLSDKINILVHCGSGFSFTSSHATNHFGLANLFQLILGPLLFSLKKNRIYFAFACYLWAFSIAFSQVYVGVHYPIDIIAGAILGLCLSSLTYNLFKVLNVKGLKKY